MTWDPKDHPRWPGGAPQHRGGQFADSPTAAEYKLFKTDGQNWLRSLSRRMTRGRWRPGQWRLEDPEQYHQEQLDYLHDYGVQIGTNPRQVQQLVAAVAARTSPPAVVLANGPHRLAFQTEIDDYGAVSDMFDRLIRVSPITSPARVLVARGIPDGNQASVLYPSPTMLFDAALFENDASEHELAISMPSARTVPWWQYVMAHEWGHVHAGEHRNVRPDIPDWTGMSQYGRLLLEHPGMEAYAEAHAEWFLTEGETTNPSVIAIAERHYWRWPQ